MIEFHALASQRELGTEEVDAVERQPRPAVGRFGRIKFHDGLVGDVDVDIELGHEQRRITLIIAVAHLSEHRLRRTSEIVAFQVVAQTVVVSRQLVVDAGIVVFVGRRRELPRLVQQGNALFWHSAELSHTHPPKQSPRLELLILALPGNGVEAVEQLWVGLVALIVVVQAVELTGNTVELLVDRPEMIISSQNRGGAEQGQQKEHALHRIPYSTHSFRC